MDFSNVDWYHAYIIEYYNIEKNRYCKHLVYSHVVQSIPLLIMWHNVIFINKYAYNVIYFGRINSINGSILNAKADLVSIKNSKITKKTIDDLQIF